MEYFVYVLKSEKDGKHYTGISNDPARRLKQHNQGDRATPSTKSRGPFKLIYSEKVRDRKMARKREQYLKSGTGREFIRNITKR
jgi:putative endonuclease